MSLNPKRILTKKGRKKLLLALNQPTGVGPFAGAMICPVLAAELSGNDDEVTSVTFGAQGLELEQEFDVAFGPTGSNSGKYYVGTNPMSFGVTTATGPQTVVGILMSEANTAVTALAYFQLDEPILLDESTETMVVSIEIGFAGQSFYATIRLLPLGD